VDRADSGSGGPCHCHVHPSGDYLFVAHYTPSPSTNWTPDGGHSGRQRLSTYRPVEARGIWSSTRAVNIST
jgi:hypothetical protein